MVFNMDGLKTKQNIFVFVVCGGRGHIETLHFSLRYLKHFSKNEIVVLTDTSRNELNIEHSNIFDVATPKEFNNHQASIYLKTGIHKFVPKGKTYCYLDSDVVALNPEVDLIFKEYLAPITFAPDHCKLRTFSPYAVNCDCAKNHKEEVGQLNILLQKYDLNEQLDAEAKKVQQELIHLFNTKKQNKLKYLGLMIRYAFAGKRFELDKFYLNKKEKTWYEKSSGKAILYDFSLIAKKLTNQSQFRWNKWKRVWVNEKNEAVFELQCDHLAVNIQKQFDVKITSLNWQHWNGGVFLFDDRSKNFLDAWHDKSIQIFKLEDWKTRDQGTLIATAWEFGLKNHKTLNKKWNFIADYNKSGLAFNQDGLFTDDFWKNQYQSSFVHIYHHWGDENWGLWNWVEANPLNK